MFRLLSAVVAILALSACLFPRHYVLRPGAEGAVVSSQTGLPLPDAQVSIGQQSRETPVITGSDGHFLIPASQSWGLAFTPGDPTDKPWPLIVHRAGYKMHVQPITPPLSHNAIKQVGAISLDPD